MATPDLSSDHGKECHPLQIEKKLQFYDISWDIEYMYVQCCQENLEICTPEVEGPQKTKLMLTVKLTDADITAGIKDTSYSFLLKRSASDFGPEAVLVNFRLDFYGVYDQRKCLEKNKLCCLTKGAECEITFKGMDRCSCDESKAFEPVSSHMRCIMLIYIDDENTKFEECSDEGLKALSEDILTLREPNRDYDIELKIGRVSLVANKLNLCAYSGFFKRLIDPSGVTVSLDLSDVFPDEDYEAVRKVVEFISTGDLKHVLEEPSLSIYELAHKFDIQALKKYYICESLTFASRMESQEFIFNWSIRNFKSALEDKSEDKYLSSPVLTDCDSGRTFQHYFCFPENEDYATIVVETNKEIKSRTLWIQISFIDEDENLENTMAGMFKTEDYGSKISGIKEFVKRNCIESYITSDILNIVIRFVLFTGRQNSETGKHRISSSLTY